MTRGDVVQITYRGRSVRAMVLLASPNERSLMLGFDGALGDADRGLFMGAMPVLQDDAGVYRDLLHGDEVVIAKAQP